MADIKISIVPAPKPEPLQHVMILGNAYGIMPYQVPLAHLLAERGFSVHWFSFSGQAGTTGIFSGDSGVSDIKAAIDHFRADQPDCKLSVVAHCAGSLFFLECLRRHPDVADGIGRVAIYGLLFNPARRRARAEPRLKRSGVTFQLSDYWWNYNPTESLQSAKVPIALYHAKDKINLERANEQELSALVELVPKIHLRWFPRGYDSNLATLPSFINRYESWFRQGEV